MVPNHKNKQKRKDTWKAWNKKSRMRKTRKHLGLHVFADD
jgi:hypothetical protein